VSDEKRLDLISESAIILELDVSFSTLTMTTNLENLSKMDASKTSNEFNSKRLTWLGFDQKLCFNLLEARFDCNAKTTTHFQNN
jgi:hypothetical protein